MLRPNFEKCGGLVPVIVQDDKTNEVLMLAYMNEEAYDATLRSSVAHYFSRSRNKLWRKGEESGNEQFVNSVLIDCDEDTLLLKVHQAGGAACHTGYRSCFFRRIIPDLDPGVGPEGYEVVGNRVFDPEEVYKKK
ncbi:MAG: phosphoribosyl-AMP cyclohydrolase [Planctomycetaceae bacterium]|jgi:phosphoribosyl-AMP cyclohydrolase|nr:phosphoribosyl-AMP cyclohydrolase [Planctomycetaceae bacterium]